MLAGFAWALLLVILIYGVVAARAMFTYWRSVHRGTLPGEHRRQGQEGDGHG